MPRYTLHHLMRDSAFKNVNTAPVQTVPAEEHTSFDSRSLLRRTMIAPQSLRPTDVLGLQRSIGNRGVGQLLAQPLPGRKLTVDAPGDKYEREADRVAEQVADQITNPRQIVQPQEGENKDAEPLMHLPDIRRMQNSEGGSVDAALEQAILQAQGGGQSLPERVREPIEHAFGADFSSVRIHADAHSDRLNRSLQARAFTTGQDIFFRQGEYSPESREGRAVLAHELTHVVQQGGKPQNIGASLGVIQRLKWDDLPNSVTVGNEEFNLRKNIYWRKGSSGYENGNHFTLLSDYEKTVQHIHFSENFEISKGHSAHVYFYYNVAGDAPNISVTGRRLDEKTQSVDKPIPSNLRQYLKLVENRANNNITWDVFQNLQVGDLTIDQQILKFIAALNATPKPQQPSVSKTTATAVRPLIGGTPKRDPDKASTKTPKKKKRKKNKNVTEKLPTTTVEALETVAEMLEKTPEEQIPVSSGSLTPEETLAVNPEALKTVAEELKEKPGMLDKYFWELMILGALTFLSFF